MVYLPSIVKNLKILQKALDRFFVKTRKTSGKASRWRGLRRARSSG
jgi:hypothetical protein